MKVTTSMSEDNLNFITVIVKFSNCCGFIPRCNYIKKPRLLLLYRALSALMIFIVVSINVYFYVCRQDEFYGATILNTFVFVKGFFISASLLNGYTTAIIRNTEDYKRFMHLTIECCKLHGKHNYRQFSVIFWIVSFNVYLIGVNAYNIYLWKYNVGLDKTKYLIFQGVQGYLFYMISMYLFSYIIFIKRTLTAARKMLQYWMPQQSLKRLKEIIFSFSTICDLMDGFNDIFGIQLFLTLILLLYDIILTINIIIVSDFKENHPNLFVVQIFWTFTLIIPGILAATFCEQMKYEIRNVKTICTKAASMYDKEIRDQFTALLDTLNNRTSNISAGGFFCIDHNLLFTHVNILLTYLIVAVQFSSSKT
ncbi:PREDICTED: uncharacterized protein LOC108561504 [Nicrophorus vespilloides]|uniref:Gustatory receptor n=1 Tax=Nicrophorus vespilloides TaxID=110193 RepID=A0ABM1MK59_NICVS|nr:PREDICTED: uncharacterized protein LOC108561504 [Nicrophorus vespilloides]